jgi:Uncharacterised nucleotidyltransferase
VREITPFSPEESRRYLGDAEVATLACAEVDAIRSGTGRALVGIDAPEEFRRKAAFAASVQGLAPRLAALPDLDLLPPDLRLHLEGEAGRCAARGQRILGLLDRVGSALAAEGIRALPLKGSALLLRGEIPAGLRPMADLDLLLDSEADVRRAAGLLTAGLGYRVLWNTARHLVLAEEHEAVLLWACEHPGNPLRIELHRSFRLDLLGTVLDATPELRIATEKIGGWEVPTREALAHHLLFHAAEDFAAKGLRGVQAVDFLVLARRHGLLAIPDVPKAGRAPLLYAVDAVERLFPGSFDHEGVGRLAAKVPAALRARAAAIPVLRHSRPERGWTATSLSLVDGAAPKVRFLIRTLFPRLDEVKANVAPGADGPALWAAWAKVLARRLSSGVRRLIGR